MCSRSIPSSSCRPRLCEDASQSAAAVKSRFSNTAMHNAVLMHHWLVSSAETLRRFSFFKRSLSKIIFRLIAGRSMTEATWANLKIALEHKVPMQPLITTRVHQKATGSSACTPVSRKIMRQYTGRRQAHPQTPPGPVTSKASGSINEAKQQDTIMHSCVSS